MRYCPAVGLRLTTAVLSLASSASRLRDFRAFKAHLVAERLAEDAVNRLETEQERGFD